MAEHDSLQCPCCKQVVTVGHAAHRGILINTIAELSAAALIDRENLQKLRTKRWNKAHAKKHQDDLQLITRLDSQLDTTEELIANLKTLNRTLYGV